MGQHVAGSIIMDETFKERSARIRAEREERKRTRIQTDDTYVNRYMNMEYAGEVFREQLENDPEFREYFRETVKEGIANSEIRQAYHASDEFKAHMDRFTKWVREQGQTPEGRAFRSKIASDAWKDPEYARRAIEKMYKRFEKVENHPRYLGPVVGISTASHHMVVIRGLKDYKRHNIRRGTVEDAVNHHDDHQALGFTWCRSTEDQINELRGLGYIEIEHPRQLRPVIVARKPESDELLCFEAMKDVTKAGYHRGHVWNSIKTGCLYKGYQWTKEDR